MVGKTTVIAVVAATSAVAFPYATALFCNLAFGWPEVRNRFRRAFHPKKVFSLNICLIQKMIITIKYASLYFQWKAYYKSASPNELIKGVPYGRNGQALDLHFPKTHREAGDSRNYPVVIFVYGGAWGSGDRSMYGLLCSAIANKLDVIVCCPNHTTYPKGYTDMMIQDIVDTISWLHQNIEQHKGNKNKLMLVGHSSGAHICAMTMLELLHDQIAPSSTVDLQPVTTNGFQFSERHFDYKYNGNSDNEERQSSESSGSFLVVDGQNGNGQAGKSENGEQNNDQSTSSSLTTSQFELVQTQKSETELSEGSMLESELRELTQTEESGLRYRGSGEELSASGAPYIGGAEAIRDVETDEDEDSVDTVKHAEGDLLAEFNTQPTVAELGKSVKAVVGIAGVYHIGDHFLHESERGVEDISSMARAMRGRRNFDRFSPTHILQTLTGPVLVSFPKTVLLHGTEDYVVPLTSTTKFSEEMKRHDADVTVRIIPSCDHYEICMDLMGSDRKFHNSLMGILEDTAKSVFM